MPILSLGGVTVTRSSGTTAFELRVDRLEVEAGARLALVGPSGCGKSTLLDLLAFVLIPDAVRRFRMAPRSADPIDLTPLFERRDLDRLAALRRTYTGYVLQTGGLLGFATVRQNIALPLLLLGRPPHPAVADVAELLGIAQHLEKKPAELSFGERQRVAIARAVVHQPEIVLADEPTASLDPARSDEVMQMLVSRTGDIGCTLVVASHDVERVRRFGLQRLRHDFLPSSQPELTVARFGD